MRIKIHAVLKVCVLNIDFKVAFNTNFERHSKVDARNNGFPENLQNWMIPVKTRTFCRNADLSPVKIRQFA